MHQVTIQNFSHWRNIARQLRQAQIPPESVRLLANTERSLFDDSPDLLDMMARDATDSSRAADGSSSNTGTLSRSSDHPQVASFQVPRDFLTLAEEVGYHRHPERWLILYRVLWRLTTGEPRLMQLATDDDIHQLLQMEKAVRRDAHKMKAFVRFREVIQADQAHFIAWHRPDHFVVRKVAPFFSRRFKAMHWTILTPDESVTWDQQTLTYFAGVDRSAAPSSDQLEDLWRTYYANIFNPARIKLNAMKKEMPVRHWATLPETSAIDEMLQAAPQRVKTMLELSEGFARTARDYFPENAETLTLANLANAARHCQACDLHCQATQVVFGRGPQSARIVLVGEQPGDQEDVAGEPFIGPAGEVLNRALQQAGLDRSQLYVTNVVKHFKFERSGKRRLHKRPDAREIRACRPWFEAEWAQLQASVLVCLGATPATALIQPGFRIQQQRGQWVQSRFCPHTLATWHPSSILRLPDAEQQAARFAELVADLRLVKLVVGSG